MRKTLAVLATTPLLAAAEPPLTIVDKVVANARIEAIDHDARELTLVDGSGSGEAVGEGGQGPNPGATLSRQQTETLTIVSVDAGAPSAPPRPSQPARGAGEPT